MSNIIILFRELLVIRYNVQHFRLAVVGQHYAPKLLLRVANFFVYYSVLLEALQVWLLRFIPS